MTFDIIFSDPPYNFTDDQFERIIKIVFNRNLLNAEGYLIIEHSKHSDLSLFPHFQFSKKYGGSVFSFFSVG